VKFGWQKAKWQLRLVLLVIEQVVVVIVGQIVGIFQLVVAVVEVKYMFFIGMKKKRREEDETTSMLECFHGFGCFDR
jgi:hypothetical protein